MPLEIRRCDISMLHPLPGADVPAGAGDGELVDCYIRAIRAAGSSRRAVTVPLLGLEAGFSPERSLRAGVRAASIILVGEDLGILLAVPEGPRFDLTQEGLSDLGQYIAQRYEGGVEGGIFGHTFRRSPPLSPAAVRPVSAAHASVPVQAAAMSLEKMLERTDAGFSETLLRLIDASCRKDSEIYKKANIDRRLFSKIRSSPAYRPSRSTALALAFALELDLDGVRDLIGRAGYTLTHASRGDIIIEYFIENRDYDIFRLNETLFAFDQPLLGGM